MQPIKNPTGSRRARLELSAIGLTLLTATLFAPSAFAASDDAAAQELADQAIFSDYLQLEFKAAEKKLKRAIELCERGDCSNTVQAQVYRDLAVVYVTGMKREDQGRKLLVRALELDPRIALDADLTTPELVRVFGEAQERAREPAEPEPEPAAAPLNPPLEREAEAGEPKSEDSLDLSVEDCPPDFPGCESVEEREAREAAEAEALAEQEESGGVKNWISARLQQDFLMFSGETRVCTTEAPDELSCYYAGDTFRSRSAGYAGTGGEVSGGLRPATLRLMLGYERQLLPKLKVGLLAGYAFGGGPAEPDGPGFVPVHAELTATYAFAVSQLPIEPYALFSGGLAQVDSSVATDVVDQQNNVVAVDEAGRPIASRVTVWKKTGTTFASVGAGARYPLSEVGAISAELKAMLLFPSSGLSGALQIGYNHGF